MGMATLGWESIPYFTMQAQVYQKNILKKTFLVIFRV
jgi:hypothetical protein